jgi:cyclopropane fatty-acyl-phospholipid synthase-like methyltransferase
MNIAFVILLLLAVLFLWPFITNSSGFFSAPFVPTEPKVVARMLDIADIKKGETLYDLGSGDGRVVVSAALRGAYAVGVEMDPVKAMYSRLFIKILRLHKTAKIVRQNFFETDLKNADVVSLFLLQHTNQKLKKKLVGELKKGSRVVSYAFTLEGWKPDKIYLNNDSNFGPIYLYEIK